MGGPRKNPMIPVEEKLPPTGRTVIVVCKEQGSEYRCAGYWDEKGTWRGSPRNDELMNVIGWMEIEANR